MLLEWISIHSEDESRENLQNEIKETYLEDFDTAVYEKIIPQMYDNNGMPAVNYDELEEQLFQAKAHENYHELYPNIPSSRRPMLYPELPDHLLDIAYFRILKNMRPYLDDKYIDDQLPYITNNLGNYSYFPTPRQISATIVRTKRIIKEGKAQIFDLRVQDEQFEHDFEKYYERINEELHDRYSYELSKYPSDRLEEIHSSSIKELILQINTIIDSQEDLHIKKRVINGLLYKISVEYNGGVGVYNILKAYCESDSDLLSPQDGPHLYCIARQLAYLSICKTRLLKVARGIQYNIQKIFMMATTVAASHTFNSFLNNYFGLLDDLNNTVNNYSFNASSKIRRFFNIDKKDPNKISSRCVAIIEFPKSPSRNLFSVSGAEYKIVNGIIQRDSIFQRLSTELSVELAHLGHYSFCEQSLNVRRFNIYDSNDEDHPKTRGFEKISVNLI